mmetsp:Transcript_2360/g.7352  ORF Transcript_2360/g.7352 Transcript_2360/m.7352 type:complete len:657 (-) Transcript_2360:52-2022(-)
MRDLSLSDLRDAAKEELSSTIAKIAVGGDRSKAVLVEPRLRQSLEATGLSAAFSEAAGVQMVRNLDVRVQPSADVRTVVLVVRPSLALMKDVGTIINVWNAFKQTYHFHVLFVPKRTFICCHMLQNEYHLAEKYGKRLEITEVEVDFFVAEDDVLSMEQPTLFRDLFMEGDTTALQYIAKALVKLQTAKIGLVPKVVAKGGVAVRTLDFMRRMISDVGVDYMQEQASQVDRLFILDRGVDLATPMLTQQTYEGMIHEAHGAVCGRTHFPFEVPGSNPSDHGLLLLNRARDEIFDTLRDHNFGLVGPTLHQKSLGLQRDYDRRKEMSHREMIDFVKQLPERKRLVTIHTKIAQELSVKPKNPAYRRRLEMEQHAVQQTEEKEVAEYVDEMMNKGEPMISVLRFLCLMSVTNGGLKPKLYDQLKEAFMLSYGIPQTLAGWYCLERCGLLTKNTTGLLDRGAGLVAGMAGQFGAGGGGQRDVPFSNLRKACRLWVENLNEAQPNDVAYAYGGYAPLMLRTIEAMDQYAQKTAAAASQALRGADAMSAASSTPMRAGDTPSRVSASGNSTGYAALDQAPGEVDVLMTGAEAAGSAKTALIFIIGGVTASEANAVRTIFGAGGVDADGNPERTQYVVASTAVITGSSLIESLLPSEQPHAV